MTTLNVIGVAMLMSCGLVMMIPAICIVGWRKAARNCIACLVIVAYVGLACWLAFWPHGAAAQ